MAYPKRGRPSATQKAIHESNPWRDSLIKKGWSHYLEGGVIHLKGTAMQAIALANSPDLKHLSPTHTQRWGEWNSHSHDRFACGTLAQLQGALKGDIDMQPFEAARARFATSQLAQKLKTRLGGANPVRRRRLDEFTGNWDFMRRWEDKPYEQTFRQPMPIRCVEFETHWAISGGMRGETIDNYGAIIWGLSQLIEAMGIQVGITYKIHIRNPFSEESNLLSQVSLRVKNPGEYINSGTLAAVCTSNFFRRIGFQCILANAEAAGKRVNWGLGNCNNPDQSISFTDGKLVFAPSIGTNGFSGFHADTEKAICRALGINPDQ